MRTLQKAENITHTFSRSGPSRVRALRTLLLALLALVGCALRTLLLALLALVGCALRTLQKAENITQNNSHASNLIFNC